VLSLPDIANRLDDQFQLLTGGSSTEVERHQTLRAAVDWSYDLLTEPEQVLLARLAVFAGGCSLDAAEAICSDETVSAAQVLDLVEHLVDRSLVDAERTDAVLRYRLLESIRQYGNERLAHSGDADAVRMRHRDYFASFAARAQRGLWGPESPRWASEIDLDLDNIRAAIVWSLMHDEHEAALQIVTFLDMYWFSWMTRRREGLRLFEQCLERAGGDVPPPLLARSLGATSFLNSVAGDLQRAIDTGEQATDLYRQLGDQRGLAMSLNSLARAARDLGRLADAQVYAEEAVEVGRAAGFAPGLGSALVITGSIAQLRGDLDTARSAFHEVLASRDRQVPGNLYESLHGLGLIAFADGATDTARQWFEESVKLEPTVTAAPASATFGLAVVALATGDTARARCLVEDALDYYTSNDFSPWPGWHALLGDVEFQEGNLDLAESLRRDALERLTRVWNPMAPALSQHLMGMARLALARGNASRAAVLIGAGDASRKQLGVPFFVLLEWQHPSQAASAARAALGHNAYTAAWETGNSMTPEQAVNFALERPDNFVIRTSDSPHQTNRRPT
jgi:tetratricopeptide (TPR) repeat protein